MASTFSREFKTQIVELFRQGGRTFKDIAEEFDLSATTVANWVRQDASSRGKLLPEAKPSDSPKDDKSGDRRVETSAATEGRRTRDPGKALAFFACRKDQ
ncbi:transposase [Amycolatopsis sp. RTGN1]|uniref:transposase n=1 Tax=Amycolatopsis ponsaeliensis TaxID=2992142 RepID=UPI00254B9F30|nr:transposase [Amycolatopsis sp. RTGN1]